MTKVLYLHGFGSSPNSDKVHSLSAAFDVVAPQIPIDPDVARKMIFDLAGRLPKDTIVVGTSLGGYWASEVSDRFLLSALIINPSTSPRSTLSKRDSTLSVDLLNRYQDLAPRISAPKIVLLAENDEILDYRIAESLYSHCADVRIQKTGNHKFNEINTICEAIKELQQLFYLP